jgi:predicted molibdopterin-dependent oxidoreductase YjgC
MGCPLPFSSLQQVMDEIGELVPLYKGYTDSERPFQSELDIWEARHTYEGQFLKGFARFSPVEHTPPAEGTKEDYPFTLLTGTILYHFGTGTRSSRASRLKKFSPQAFVEISEADAKNLSISDGEKVNIISPVGELTAIVKITNTLPEGMLFMPISFPNNSVNKLFDIILDSEAKTPSFKVCNVRIERM